MAFDIGDVLRIHALFTVNGVPTDPGTGPVFKHKDPSGNIATKTYPTDVEVVKDATGSFHLDLTIDEAGEWHYRVSATGTAAAAEEGNINVAVSEF